MKTPPKTHTPLRLAVSVDEPPKEKRRPKRPKRVKRMGGKEVARKSWPKVGTKFNRLTSIGSVLHGRKWLFECECGRMKFIGLVDVMRGTTKSCGCLQRETARISQSKWERKKGPEKDLIGQTFLRWTVIGHVGLDRFKKNRIWRCRCVCGNEGNVLQGSLLRGVSGSCGCLQIDLTKASLRTHGLSKTPGYSSWVAMLARCYNEKHSSFYRYGGRGIRVCKRWRTSVSNFFEDMGVRPPGHSIERIDYNGNYTPKNCKWAVIGQQNRNKSSNVPITVAGVTMVQKDWCLLLGIPESLIRKRNLIY